MAEIEEVQNNRQARRWILTINNPTQSDDEFAKYITELEHHKYSVFQREKGHETGTEHFQVFIIFSIGKRFSTIKSYFPTAHIEQAKGTNVQCRDYCSKSDTRIGQVHENGQFAEERQRTDKENFLRLVQAGASDEELSNLFAGMYLDKFKDVDSLYRKSLKSKYKNMSRDVEVTYIYGSPRSGKTSYIFDKYQPKDFYRVTLYNNSAFDDYKDEDVIVFDEFNSSFKITDMNNFLDRYYVDLPARYGNRFTVYTKVYIISNLPLSKQYVDEQDKHPELYQAFLSRIHNVMYKDNLQSPFLYEKKVSCVVQSSIDDELFSIKK